MKTFLIGLMMGLPLVVVAAEKDPHGGLSPDQLDFFEKKIRPVLVEHCYRCHSVAEDTLKGGLALDSKDALLLGGDSGHAVVPGNVRESLLIEAIRYDNEDLQMPPKKQLPESVVADFVKWVEMGAPDPRVENGFETLARKEIDWDKAKEFWAFQKPVKKQPPTNADPSWARTDIDRFIKAGLEAKGLEPVADADKRTLIRRVYFDLIGLPPTPLEVDLFVTDTSPDAFEKVVDDLLSSKHFGERWGRHWLDVARYGESSGKESNFTFPHAWRYRDYVIDAFNADKPYNEFVTEQLAGDLITSTDQADRNENLIATGFLAIGTKSLNERNIRQFAMDVADEQIDTMSQAMLGLTVACARCHDHKFDPIPTKDYYSLAGIFLSTQTYYGTPQVLGNNRPSDLLPIYDDSEEVDLSRLRTPSELQAMNDRLETLTRERAEIQAQLRRSRFGGSNMDPQEASDRRRDLLRLGTQIGTLEAEVSQYDELGIPRQMAMGVKDRSRVSDARILIRGEVDKPSDPVERGFVTILSDGNEPEIPNRYSGRKELAHWMTSETNPLTARVFANRVWHHLFGKGIVASVDNFGAMGELPSNPELLDYLAMSFMENGWSIKSLIKQVVMTRTYQLGSEYNFANFEKDPENRLHWRMSQRRLDAESIRDAMLAISGNLEIEAPNASPVAKVGEGNLARLRFVDPKTLQPNARSVYLPIIRDMVPESLALFDFAEPSLVTGVREETTVPAQGLYMLNSEFVVQQAAGFTRRLADSGIEDPVKRLELAFEMALCRKPTPEETDSIRKFIEDFNATLREEGRGQVAARQLVGVSFCQALLACAEFRYLN